MTGSTASAPAPGRHICLFCPVPHLANTCWLASVFIYSIFICSDASWFDFIYQCLQGSVSGISTHSAWSDLQLNDFFLNYTAPLFNFHYSLFFHLRTARETQQESTASNVQMASSVTLSEECPRSASPAPAPCQRLPSTYSPCFSLIWAGFGPFQGGVSIPPWMQEKKAATLVSHWEMRTTSCSHL